MTRFLIMLTCLFASATLGAAMALFSGWPVGIRSISMSRQPIPRTPSPRTLLTASLAAQRPANVSGRSRT